MKNYINKLTATYRFKTQVLNNWDEEVPLTLEEKETLWKVYLLTIKGQGKISGHQAKTWTYPHGELEKK